MNVLRSLLTCLLLPAVRATCYLRANNKVFVDLGPSTPCSNADGVQNCCVGDSICSTGQQNFCRNTHPEYNTTRGPLHVSGYYVSRCTDDSYEDARCSFECSDYPTQDVVYNSTTGLWACCWQSQSQQFPDCSNPGPETFQGPAPALLLDPAVSSSSSSSSSTSGARPSPRVTAPNGTSSVLSKASPTSATGNTLPSSGPRVLSAGAKAAIGVGVIIAASSILLVSAYIWRRHALEPQENPVYRNDFHELPPSDVNPYDVKPYDVKTSSPQLASRGMPSELGGASAEIAMLGDTEARLHEKGPGRVWGGT